MREFANIQIENATLTVGATRAEVLSLPAARIVVSHSYYGKEEVFTLEITESLFGNDTLKKELVKETAKIFKIFLKKYSISRKDLVLVLGVGNEGMTADALGAKTLKYLDITEQYHAAGVGDTHKGRLAAVAGGVSGVTGLASFDVAMGVVGRVQPKLIFAVDTLASRRASRLQRTVQITDVGLVPGSGVNNDKEAFSAQTLGVPVVAVGVPLVIYAKNILSAYVAEGMSVDIKRAQKELGELVVTVKEIDISVDDYAKIIATGINTAIHKR